MSHPSSSAASKPFCLLSRYATLVVIMVTVSGYAPTVLADGNAKSKGQPTATAAKSESHSQIPWYRRVSNFFAAHRVAEQPSPPRNHPGTATATATSKPVTDAGTH